MKTKLYSKRSLAVILSVLMIFSSLVFSVGAEDPEHVHSYDEGVITTEPTCLEAGVRTYTCTTCAEGTGGHSYTDPVPALGHNWVKKYTVAPTCSQQGYDVETCSRCQVSRRTNFVDPNGHSYVSEAVSPTCTTEGGVLYTCSVCDENEPGHSYFVADADALGHDLGEFVIVPGDAEKTFFLNQAACQREGCTYTANEANEDGTDKIYYRVQYFNNDATDTTETAADGTIVVTGRKSVFLETIFVPSGEKAEYTGKTPVKELDRDFGEYEFTGWSADGGSLENVTANITASALFEGKATQHWVKFYNLNGKELVETQYVNHGEGVADPGITPTYSRVGYYNYSFKGWDRDFSHVYSNCAVMADYEQTGKTYKIVYCDSKDYGSGEQIGSEVFTYGNAPTPDKYPTPVKADDNTFYYEFSGKWLYEYEAPSGNTTAMFTEEYDPTILRCPSNAICLDCNRGYDSFEYDPANENDQYMTDIEKGIIRVYADYYTRAKIYRVRVVAVDSDGDPIPNGGTIQVLNPDGSLAKVATLGADSAAVLELTYKPSYTLQVTYSGEVAQQTIALDERNLSDNYPTVRVMLGSPSVIQEDGGDTCTCISHMPVIGRIYIAILNVIYRLTGRKIVCCFDMYEKHGDQLVYTA